ncbi:MAG: Rho termination factor N-terminal domain-containing protein [Candidatus Promineifilaceae bacterium]
MMQKHEASELALTDVQLQDVIERAEVTTPVLAYKVSGNRVELHLLGGPIAYVEADWLIDSDEAVEKAAELFDDLESLTQDALYKLAQALNIRGRSSMAQPELVAAIKKKQVSR